MFPKRIKKAILTASASALLMVSGCSNSDPALSGVNSFIASQSIDKTNKRWKTNLPKPEQVSFNAQANYYWDMETNLGNIVVKLMPDVAPMHVSSTMYLTELGFYDGLIFHRVIPTFMAQGGDPLGTGRGGPGFRYGGEFSEKVRHDKPGLLSMANAGPNTDGSQFFITFKATPWLDGRHTIFGEVVDGLETTIAEFEKRGSRTGKTSEELTIIKASIRVEVP